jgi:hypothetical protein
MADLEEPNPGVWKPPERKVALPERYNVHLDVAKPVNQNVLVALMKFHAGEIEPGDLDLLLKAVATDTLKDVAEEFEIASGADYRRYARKLTALAIEKNRPPEKPPAPDAFSRHSITLPCGDQIHYSNVEVVTTCLKCGAQFNLMELVPILKKLLDSNPDIVQNSTQARSRFDVFNGLRGK